MREPTRERGRIGRLLFAFIRKLYCALSSSRCALTPLLTTTINCDERAAPCSVERKLWCGPAHGFRCLECSAGLHGSSTTGLARHKGIRGKGVLHFSAKLRKLVSGNTIIPVVATLLYEAQIKELLKLGSVQLVPLMPLAQAAPFRFYTSP